MATSPLKVRLFSTWHELHDMGHASLQPPALAVLSRGIQHYVSTAKDVSAASYVA